jgi:NAD(P)-dependent dehydrogenase (short-subunit alcohol dehydrogenase family)
MADQPDMSGKVVVITGGNSGIGRAAAADLVSMGATVLITSRDADRGAGAVAEIRSTTSHGTVELVSLDLASFASIRACASQVLERFDRLDVLVNNAGGIISDRRLTGDGFEMTFGVNHLGHFLLTRLLLDRLEASAPARVINVASVAHRFSSGFSFADPMYESRRYFGTDAYNQSKLANILFTQELARRLMGRGVTANSMHPGAVRSGFGAAGDTRGIERAFLVMGRPFLIGPKRGARTIVYLASSPKVADVTGKYFVRRRVHKPSRAARDVDTARRLWELSEELVASVTPPLT